ncbi:methionine--tRNA ligase [Segniliparus rugosus]|uniref:Methionine--tRNA ligase n=1 Tax=Segniliparus rugosus (strain ATCC BAA-974 / DSM 45345 / CCUG 50838 / CIP 108380 / JCM 13579 / CDC 945) TaxID=679197 RepID=E5XLA1_SEGRC|nr:methionine--tRNA ligase [Segniliparus rugosus]EFV14887.1 methionine-tRNA ligase [Segniliparus rugosus ATCC BAA-974]
MTRTPYYITTAITYANGTPHFGHAYEFISADALARFARLDGKEVFFSMGMDEYGLKVQQSAEKEGVSPQAFVDRVAERFRELHAALGSSYDRFIRTTEPAHAKASQELWRRMSANGDVYEGRYAGWYSVRDEAFYGEEETQLGEDGVRIAIPTGTPVAWTEESTYFFRLSAYQDRLLQLYQEHPEFIGPESRRNEIVSFVSQGLKDLSISRSSFNWGVPVPDSPGHVMYVWVDALTNYLTAIGFPDDTANVAKFWPADLEIIGKDITRFHAVYWPAFLLSAGFEPPKRVFGHGFVLNKGQKMSKSAGTGLDPFWLVETFGQDAVRFFALREIPYGQDGSYSDEAIVTRANADLSNGLGNLAQRCLTMIAKNFGGAVPRPAAFSAEDEALLGRADALLAEYRPHFEAQRPDLALAAVFDLVSQANGYFTAQAPWTLKEDLDRMGSVLYVTAEVVRQAAILLQPAMPQATEKLLDLLGQEAAARSFADLASRISPGLALPEPHAVFPRLALPKEDA